MLDAGLHVSVAKLMEFEVLTRNLKPFPSITETGFGVLSTGGIKSYQE